YLWHWPVFVLFRWTIGLEDWRYVLLALALTFGLAVVSYYWVENVFRQTSALQRIPSSAIVIVGLASLAGAAALELSAFHLQKQLTLSVTRDTEVWYPIGPRRTTGNDGECRTTSEHTEKDGTDVTAFLRKNCASGHAQRELYVAGDSHA